MFRGSLFPVFLNLKGIALDAELINPFINSTINVIKTMAALELTVDKPTLKKGKSTWGEVTGLIGLAGYQGTGNMILSFDKPSILKIVNGMLGEQFSDVNDQIVDAVGELTNMISGGAKRSLNDLGFFFEMAAPVTIVGQNVEIKQLTKDPVITVPFNVESGSFVLEAALRKE